MSLIDSTFFQSYHRQKEEDFSTTFLDLHIPNAEIDLMNMVSDEVYADAEAILEKPENERTKEEKRKLKAFQNAEAELTMADVIPDINLVVGDSGIIQSSHTQDFGQGTFKIASPKDIDNLVEMWQKKATRLLDRYVEGSMGIVGRAVGEEE